MTRAGSFPSERARAWHAFVSEPARDADMGRLAACFGGGLGPDLCARLAQSDRLEPRLSRLLVDHYGLDPIANDAVDETDRAIALSSFDRLAGIARRAGTIYWSGALANAVLARDVAIVVDALGEELYAFALANRDLSGPATSFPALDSAAAAIDDAGWRCIVAWCAAGPPGILKRMRLRLPAGTPLDAPPDPALSENGPEIVRRAAAEQGWP